PTAWRIWSAGCSTGEEPYSIAVTVSDALKFPEAWEIEILATDVSRRALRHAERGTYSRRSLGEVSLHQVEAYFTPTKHGYQGSPRTRRLSSSAKITWGASFYRGN